MINERYRWRLGLIVGVCLLAAAVLVGRLFWVQILDHGRYVTEARKAQEQWIELDAYRGTIYDRNMVKLATSVPTSSLFAVPCIMGNRRTLCRELRRHGLGQYAERITTARGKEKFRWVARKLPYDYQPALEELQRFNGLRVVREQARYYPGKSQACHLLGCCDIDEKGVEGLERRYDDVLSGEEGDWRLIAIGSRQFPVPSYPVNEPEQGQHLILTLDSEWQRIVEAHLARAVTRLEAKGGTVVIENARDGAILAMANYPVYDPNDRGDRKGEKIRNDALFQLFECGSTFKIVTAACALEENIITPNDLIFCENGSYRVANHVFHDNDNRFGWLSFREATAKSSNIAYIKVASELGPGNLYRAVTDFGFGTLTVIDLPGERTGTIPSINTWNRLTLPSLAIGHGIVVTPLQLANAYAAIANGGTLMQPYVVREIVDNEGRVRHRTRPVEVRRVVSPGTASMLVDVLGSVVEEGTGKAAHIEGIHVAGKTGTGQIARDDGKGYRIGCYNCSFVGILPDLDDPVVIVVVVREAKGIHRHGGDAAAPLFRDIASDLFGRTPRLLCLEKKKDPSFFIVPSFEYMNLASARNLAGELSLDIEALGEGEWVVRQHPAPGRRIKHNRKIVVHTSVSHPGNGNPGIMPSLRGLSLKEAISMIGALGLKVKIVGSGQVVKQTPSPGAKIGKGDFCTLFGEG